MRLLLYISALICSLFKLKLSRSGKHDFALKSGVNKKALKVNTTLNQRKEEEFKSCDDENTLGFDEKFAEVMR